MKDEELTQLKSSMRMYGKVPAEDSETGQLLMTTNRSNPKYKYISLETFLDGLAAQGLTINPMSLVIHGRQAPQPEPAKPAAKPEPKPAVATWTKEELELLSWNDIRKLAAKYDDVPGNKGRDYITKKLIGKPKQ